MWGIQSSQWTIHIHVTYNWVKLLEKLSRKQPLWVDGYRILIIIRRKHRMDILRWSVAPVWPSIENLRSQLTVCKQHYWILAGNFLEILRLSSLACQMGSPSALWILEFASCLPTYTASFTVKVYWIFESESFFDYDLNPPGSYCRTTRSPSSHRWSFELKEYLHDTVSQVRSFHVMGFEISKSELHYGNSSTNGSFQEDLDT